MDASLSWGGADGNDTDQASPAQPLVVALEPLLDSLRYRGSRRSRPDCARTSVRERRATCSRRLAPQLLPQIADTLCVALVTVKKHMSNLMGKLEVSDRAQAVLRAVSLGLIPNPESRSG